MNRLVFGMFCLCCFNWSCIREEAPLGYTEVLKVGDELPDFAVELSDGKKFDNVLLDGKVGVLVFFRTVCPDCQEELPVVQRLYDDYKNDTRVCVGCINWREDARTVSRFWQAEGLTMPYAVECNESVYESFACNAVPMVFVSDGTRTIRYRFGDDPVASFEDLKHAIEACLPAE